MNNPGKPEITPVGEEKKVPQAETPSQTMAPTREVQIQEPRPSQDIPTTEVIPTTTQIPNLSETESAQPLSQERKEAAAREVVEVELPANDLPEIAKIADEAANLGPE